MKDYPSIPRIEDAPSELLGSGHLWLTEKIDGAQLRVRLHESGLLRFGDAERIYDDPEAIPLSYRYAVRHVRERLDRDALRAAVDDVESVVLFGVATRYETIEYDWDRIPPFLGFGVWSGGSGRFLPPDAAAKTFEQLELDPVNSVAQELNTRDFDPGSYVVPDSAWYDGPAEGVVIRNKKGGQAKLLHPDFVELDGPEPLEASAEELAERYATDRRFEAIAAVLRNRGEPVSFEMLQERVVESIAREEYGCLFHGDSSVDLSVFRSAVAERTGMFLGQTDQ